MHNLILVSAWLFDLVFWTTGLTACYQVTVSLLTEEFPADLKGHKARRMCGIFALQQYCMPHDVILCVHAVTGARSTRGSASAPRTKLQELQQTFGDTSSAAGSSATTSRTTAHRPGHLQSHPDVRYDVLLVNSACCVLLIVSRRCQRKTKFYLDSAYDSSVRMS